MKNTNFLFVSLIGFLCACARPETEFINPLPSNPTNSISSNSLEIKPIEINVDSIANSILAHNFINYSGEHIFEFFDITSPDMSVDFPSHSIVSLPVSYIGKELGIANSYCEYWLYTKDGRLVCHCKNTMSGLHPNYLNAFNSNNHLPEFRKKIAYGDYRLVYKNISEVPVIQELVFGLIINNGNDQINTTVKSGETKEFWIKIYPSETSMFKMNNNNRVKF